MYQKETYKGAGGRARSAHLDLVLLAGRRSVLVQSAALALGEEHVPLTTVREQVSGLDGMLARRLEDHLARSASVGLRRRISHSDLVKVSPERTISTIVSGYSVPGRSGDEFEQNGENLPETHQPLAIGTDKVGIDGVVVLSIVGLDSDGTVIRPAANIHRLGRGKTNFGILRPELANRVVEVVRIADLGHVGSLSGHG